MKNLIVSGVLQNGLNIYRKNFYQLTKVSLLYCLIMFFNTLSSFYTGLSKSGFSFLLGFIVTFLSIYFGFRVYISLIIIVRELVKGNRSSLKSAYNESIKYLWKSIGNYILVAIPIAVPSCFLVFVYRSELSLLYKYLLIMVLLCLIGIITSYVFFAPLSVVLKPELRSRIKFSFRIVQGCIIKVFVILFFSSFIFLIPTYSINSIDYGSITFPYSNLIRTIINNAINLFVIPLSISVSVVLFNEITDEK